MQALEGFRNESLGRALVSSIQRRAPKRPVRLMEVCGTHTMAVHRHGLGSLLPESVRLLSGPGCPVCVTPNRYLDEAIALARLDDVVIATFGDIMRVPGSSSSLEAERASGRTVRVVYSALDALAWAQAHPDRRVVFLGVGFETTAPTVAASILQARKRKAANFLVLSGHKVMPPALRALIDDPQLKVDGLICPGHVSAIIGSGPYEFLARERGIPCVIAGFEPVDILQAIDMLLAQVADHRAEVEIQYSRVVRPEGNPRARALLDEVFGPTDADWRGLGRVPQSGLGIRGAFGAWDAAPQLPVDVEPTREPEGCRCGDVLRGILSPPQCPLFGTQCTPQKPVGACMVSSEGTCAAFYRYASPRPGWGEEGG